MPNELNKALAQLQTLLDSQTALTTAQLEANRLAEDTLKIERDKADNHAKELDLQAQDLALKRQIENRRDATINEFMQRVQRQSEFTDKVVSKLVTTDEAFGETVQRLIVAIRLLTSAQIDTEKGYYALLSQNSVDIKEARLASPKRLEQLRHQELLLQHEETLHALQLQAAAHGSLETPIKLIRQIENEQATIEELSEKLR